ncbi:hypothetical protein J3459_008114 [Metarhizium acridum]|nr:hypothetical protein J3459_008114 [Metarhizium acridum]
MTFHPPKQATRFGLKPRKANKRFWVEFRLAAFISPQYVGDRCTRCLMSSLELRHKFTTTSEQRAHVVLTPEIFVDSFLRTSSVATTACQRSRVAIRNNLMRDYYHSKLQPTF